MAKKVYGKYQIDFKAFTFFDSKNPILLKKAVREALREIGCFLVEPSFKAELVCELDEPPKEKS